MDETKRIQIAEALEHLAAQPAWSDEVWEHCYKLVRENWGDPLVASIHDDLIHCSATRLFSFSRRPKHFMFDMYKDDFLQVASALRTHMPWPEFKRINNIYEPGEIRAAIRGWLRRMLGLHPKA